MEQWKKYKLGDICKTNIAQYSAKENWDSVTYLDTGNITRNKINALQLIDDVANSLPIRARRKVKHNDIIYSTVRPDQCHFGILQNPDERMLVSTGFTVITTKKHVVHPFYLYYYLTQQHITNHLHSIGEQSVSTYPSIKPSDIESIDIYIPIYPEQKRIADILKSLDDKIELNRQINDNLEQQAQALFKSWFVDFEPFKDGKFIDSELGLIPEGWRVGTLSELGEVIGGGTPSKAKEDEYYTDNGIPWLTPKDMSILNLKFVSKGNIDITTIGYKNSSAKVMPKGSVLFSSRAPIGYIAIAKTKICTNQGFKSIIPQNAGTGFIYYFLKNSTPNIESQATGSTFKEASGSLMKSLKVTIAHRTVLNDFESIVASIFAKQEKNESENQNLERLRDTLLPKLMSGELKINDLNS
ncbi:MAG: restriction endonuclease subunit S [Anaerovoracaceae bacterium]